MLLCFDMLLNGRTHAKGSRSERFRAALCLLSVTPWFARCSRFRIPQGGPKQRSTLDYCDKNDYSYEWYRAPKSKELVVEDGKLIGFCIRLNKYSSYFLKIDKDEKSKAESDNFRYTAELIIDETPTLPRRFSVSLDKQTRIDLSENIGDLSKYVKQIVPGPYLSKKLNRDEMFDSKVIFEFTEQAFEDFPEAVRQECDFFAEKEVTLLKGC